ncbi:MAG: pseudouridine synthase [Planctomycetota bacterium]
MTTTGPRKSHATLDRALSCLGIASRAEAARAIRAGRIAVNGEPVTDPARWVDLVRDRIAIAGRAAVAQARRYFAFHKPVRVVATRKDERGRKTVLDFFPAELGHLSPVGRLDQDTSGLMIITNDNQLIDRLTSPRFKVAKTYVIKLHGHVREPELDRLRRGVLLADGRTQPAAARLMRRTTHHTWIELTIREGRNRQVRRMGAAIGHAVLELKRIQIGGLALGDLPSGAWRELSPAQVQRQLWGARA